MEENELKAWHDKDDEFFRLLPVALEVVLATHGGGVRELLGDQWERRYTIQEVLQRHRERLDLSAAASLTWRVKTIQLTHK